jgi:hypothetical protein
MTRLSTSLIRRAKVDNTKATNKGAMTTNTGKLDMIVAVISMSPHVSSPLCAGHQWCRKIDIT